MSCEGGRNGVSDPASPSRRSASPWRRPAVSLAVDAMISTRDLSLLPDVNGLRALLQTMATLDAILCPEWQNRYYSFNRKWAAGQQMGSMRNGQGDDFFAHFSAAGCWLKGFAHEAPMSPYAHKPKRIWPGVLDEVPAEFAACLREPAFMVDDVTFCLWRRTTEPRWNIGPISFPLDDEDDPDPDGSAYLLSNLDGRPGTYHAFAQEYFEVEVDLASVQHVYQHRPLTPAVVAALNPELSPANLISDLDEIGYTVAKEFR